MLIYRKIFTIIFIGSLITLNLYSDEMTDEEVQSPSYIIRNVTYSIEGKTRESVLRAYLEIEAGEIIQGEIALQEYISDKEQMIENQRTLAGGDILIDKTVDPDNSVLVFVDLHVRVEDTWNYIALPYARYDSNEGLLLSLRGRNYNFLGGMETLEVNLDSITSNIDSPSEYSINGGSVIPFFFWGYHWKLYFDEDVTFTENEPIDLYSRLGMSVDIPFQSLTWQLAANQYYYLNPEGEEDPDGYYMKSTGSFGSSIPTGLEIPYLGEISYNPAIITSYAYKPFGSLSEDRRGYELGAKHAVIGGRINWLGNFRDGFTLELDQNLRYNFDRELWLSDLDLEFQGHKSFGWGALSSRVIGFYKMNDSDEDLGEPIRGILNRRIDGEAGVFVNLDFPVQMWIWFLDRWFDGHISPFFDYALVRPENGSFDLSDSWYGLGLEGFAFLKAARSIYMRISVGLDLEALLDGAVPGDPAPRDGDTIYELYIGLGHHY